MSKSNSRQRDRWIKLRCFEEEERELKEKAKAAGLSTSEFMRRCGLNKRIVTRTDTKLMNELLRLGGLQKHLYNQMQEHMTTDLSKQFSEVLVELKKAILALDLQQVPVGS